MKAVSTREVDVTHEFGNAQKLRERSDVGTKRRRLRSLEVLKREFPLAG